jgi:hypothetical protein
MFDQEINRQHGEVYSHCMRDANSIDLGVYRKHRLL